MTRRGWGIVVRMGISIGILALLGLALDPREILGQLRGADPTWILAALLLSVLQVGVSAWRWRFTAARIGLRLPFSEALYEYYLSSFLNQVLPGGVLGDVSRAWRQSRTTESRESAVRAVILERASGQMVMLTVAGACAVVLAIQSLAPTGPLLGAVRSGFPGGLVGGAPSNGPVDGAASGWAGSGGGLLAAVVGGMAILGLIGVWFRRKSLLNLWRRSWSETRRALLAPGAFGPQLLSSLFVVGSYICVFVFAARAVGAEASTLTLLVLIPPVLVAMLTPLTVGGWGLREGVAALFWTAAGLSATEGIAASVMYGLLVLASTLPGAVILGWILLTRDPVLEESVGT